MSRVAITVLCTLFVSVSLARAQDVVHLKSGEQLAGRVTDGLLAIRLDTSAGEVSIPWGKIEKIDRETYTRTAYHERAAAVADDDAKSHFILALWCRRQGLSEEMEAELGKVLKIDPDHQGARAALGFEKVDDKWVAGDQIRTAKGFVNRGGRWLLEEEAAWEKARATVMRALNEEELTAESLIEKAADENERAREYARTALAGVPWEDARLPLYRALGNRKPEVRTVAVNELGRLGVTEAVRPLIRTAVLDTSPVVREQAVMALKGLGKPGTLFPFVRALASGQPQIRMNAAAAIGHFGEIRGVEYLVSHLSQNWGPTGRVNLSVMNQMSYVQDFDVEIAQAAQIGDPIIAVLREGVILDVQIMGASRKMTVVERRVIRSALAKLTGTDQGDDGGAWAKWWADNKTRLLAEAR